MSPPLTEFQIERLAQKRAGAKLRWFVHAAVYVLVNLFLFVLSSETGRNRWSIYPAMGWGLGLALHGISVWFLAAGSGVRESMVRKERERLLREQERP